MSSDPAQLLSRAPRARRGCTETRASLPFPPELHQFAIIAATCTYPVLLYGETGSGKTHLARLIHELSARSGGSLVHINCAAVPESLFEREMFGHVRGAFTDAKESSAGIFETANGGTLFLDEIGELPLSVQPKLLRVLEEGAVRRLGATRDTPVDVRVIMATHRDLGGMVQQGCFREDLFYRCSVLEFRVPPLREQRERLPGLIRDLLAKGLPSQAEPPALGEEALDLLCAYDWPGNIRELDNSLRQAAVYAQGAPIQLHHLPARILAHVPTRSEPGAPQGAAGQRYATPDDPREEREIIRQALDAEGGNRTWAARRLGMARSTLWVKLREYGLASMSREVD